MFRFSLVGTSPKRLTSLLRQIDAGRLTLQQREFNLLLDMIVVASDAQRETQLPHKFTTAPAAAEESGDDLKKGNENG